MPEETCDFLIIGGGVIGLTIALAIRRRFPGEKIIIIEKETSCGAHASGRNSGVLHAGFYTADSLKARFTREGNQRWRAYCAEHRLPLKDTGKLIIALTEDDAAVLDRLQKRAAANDVPVEECNLLQARRIEPRIARGLCYLFVPETAVVAPAKIMGTLEQQCSDQRIILKKGCAYVTRRNNSGVRTTTGEIAAGFIVNAAGLYADRIAHDFGFGMEYQVLPFKGLYLHLNGAYDIFRASIYPVPDLSFPFLGVHLTVTVDGKATIGPTALPAFWRERYQGLEHFSARELNESFTGLTKWWRSLPAAGKNHCLGESLKIRKNALIRDAKKLCKIPAKVSSFSWGAPGIRAQMINQRTGKLLMDFQVEGDNNSLHVLNAVSPAFTCAWPFAAYCVNRILSPYTNKKTVLPAIQLTESTLEKEKCHP